MSNISKTQHYSKNKLLLDGLKDFIPKDSFIIEPFYGEGDLVKNFKVSEYYDIAFPENSSNYRDTLLNPPDYKDKWVITNPPYLAKNKAKDKTIFNKYNYDDLYKIALSTMVEANGGILIIPINFITDERSGAIRKLFFENFSINRLNIFTGSMFDETNYNVCSFAFSRAPADEKRIIPTFIYNSNSIENKVFVLESKYNYRLGGDFFNSLNQVDNIFSRLTLMKRENSTHINIVCIDKVNDPFHFYYDEIPYYGKDSDRNLATISCPIQLSIEQEKSLIIEANNIINTFRKETSNLTFTNYRDRSRKRIGFSEAYKILSLAYSNLYKS